jgi:hypothetical protein
MNPFARRPSLAMAAAFFFLSLCAGAKAAPPLTLNYIGQQIVPTGTAFAGTTVGGLSAIDYNRATGNYFAISDDRSALGPARFYELSLNLSQFQRSANPGMAGVNFSAVTTLLTPAGTPFATNTVDPEGLRYNPATTSFYWSNEGQRSSAGLQAPTVTEMRPDGSHLRSFSVPGRYLPVGSAAGNQAGDRGIVNNLAFESLTVSVDGTTLYTATENALVQDGPVASLANGSPVRLLSFDIASGTSRAEYIYNVSPVALAPQPASGFATNGLVDLLAIGDREFIAIERSFSAGAVTPGTPVTGNTIRLYHLDARNATDVSALDSIAGVANIVAVEKTLLLDLSDLRNDDGSALALDNIEGLTLGPMMNGQQTLLLVADNNFSDSQFTQFVALSMAPVPEPHALALSLAGLLAMGAVVRRRRGAAAPSV